MIHYQVLFIAMLKDVQFLFFIFLVWGYCLHYDMQLHYSIYLCGST
jgi:hypothetical protein